MTAEPKGLAVVPPQQLQASGLAAQTPEDWAEIERVFRGMVARNTSNAEIDAAILVCKASGFNPVLNHINLIDGKVYVTHKGLWHLAHRSGMLDGIEVLDEGETQTHYTARVAIYRKDMRIPFTFSGRYPKSGRNKQYGVEMALARAECMALRRAFDVSMPIYEEINWRDEGAIEGRATVREVADGTDQGRPGRAPAQLPAPGPAARVAQAGESAAPAGEAAEEPEILSWTAFWAWAKARGLNDRKTLDTVVGASTSGMTPAAIKAAIKAAILARAPGGEKRPMTAEETLEWLGAQDRALKAQERACKYLFGLSEDRAELEALYAMAQVLCHQDAVDGAWFDRTTDLGWATAVVPALDEEPAEIDGGAVQGDVAGDEPDDVPF